uniref:Coatomer subunit zeta n=1 Tax=Oryza punctata TaxID=4537 RepID=A0A0E0JQT0_ORYPU
MVAGEGGGVGVIWGRSLWWRGCPCWGSPRLGGATEDGDTPDDGTAAILAWRAVSEGRHVHAHVVATGSMGDGDLRRRRRLPPPRRCRIIGAVLIVAGLYLVLWEKSQERAIAAAKEASAAAAAAPRGVAVGGRWRRGGGLGREQVAEEHAVIGSVPEKEKSASLASFLQFSSSVLVLASLTRSLLLPSSIASLAQQSATNPPANRGIAPIPSPILQIRLPEMESCPSVKNILVLDSEGKRVAVKYYSDDWPSLSSKQAFEKSVFAKTQKTSARTEAEIVMFDSYIVVYKFIQDLHFFVTGGDEENELILASVLQGFSEAIDYLLRNKVHRRAALENLDLIFLCLDEVVDGGIVLETDAKAILEKVSGHGEGSGSLTEQKLSSALATAKEHFARSIFS